MSLFGTPEPGDWVQLTHTIKTTMRDHIADTGIKPGTRAVVISTSGWGALNVRVDNGVWGTVDARVSTRDVRLIRRGGGVDDFNKTTGRINAARAGVAAALLAPLLYFCVMWFVRGGSRDGLVAALIDSVIYGVMDMAMYAFSNPVGAILYMTILWAAGRFAFRT